MSVISRIGRRYTIVIPKEIRKKVNLKEGSLVIIRVADNKIIIEALPDDPFKVLEEVIGEPYSEEKDEDKAIELLRKYITWVKGFELIGNILHLKSLNSRSIPIYELSDGYRVATFMSLLYAISKPPKLFLIDTPEAFVHPDGLPIVADLVVHLASEGNQVVVTTQSMEFLRILLSKAREYGILEDTLVERIEVTEEGIVRAKGRWGGEVSLRSIEELGADLRR